MNQDFVDGKPMLRVTFHGVSFALPWEVGVQILNLMKEAVPLEMYYAQGTYETRWKRSKVTAVSATTFTLEEQAALMMEGD